jgi:hypothetical protein
VKVLYEAKPATGGSVSDRKNPPSDTNGDKRQNYSMLSLPQVIEIHKEHWDDHKFNEFSALDVKDTGSGGYDFFVNMDNTYLLTEIKARNDINAKLLQERYKYALVLIGMALLKDASARKEQTDSSDTTTAIAKITTSLSVILLPMISYLGELEIEN